MEKIVESDKKAILTEVHKESCPPKQQKLKDTVRPGLGFPRLGIFRDDFLPTHPLPRPTIIRSPSCIA